MGKDPTLWILIIVRAICGENLALSMNFFKKDSGFSKTGVPENQISLTSFLSTLITTIVITNALVLFMPLSLCFLNYNPSRHLIHFYNALSMNAIIPASTSFLISA